MGGILDGLGSSDFSGLPLPLQLGLSLVLQPPNVLHGEAEPAIGPAEHLETRNEHSVSRRTLREGEITQKVLRLISDNQIRERSP